MKKINLKGISQILSEKELKNVMGGSGDCSNYKCDKKPCCYSSDHCVSNYCTKR